MHHALTLIIALGGFITICLSMHRQQVDLLGRLLSAPQSLVLRVTGWLLLAIAYAVAVRGYGWGIGSVAWFGHLAAAAGVVIAVLILHSRRTTR